MLDEMRAMLTAEGLTEQDLRLRPCGCLGLCKQGPVAVAASGSAAQSRKPPKAKKKRAGVFVRIRKRKIREVLRDALSETMPPTE